MRVQAEHKRVSSVLSEVKTLSIENHLNSTTPGISRDRRGARPLDERRNGAARFPIELFTNNSSASRLSILLSPPIAVPGTAKEIPRHTYPHRSLLMRVLLIDLRVNR